MVKIIEDASHALGSRYNNKPIGNCAYSEITFSVFMQLLQQVKVALFQ